MLSHVKILHEATLSFLHNLIRFMWLESILSVAMSVKKKYFKQNQREILERSSTQQLWVFCLT